MATLRKLVGREEQREVIGNFKAVQLQPHAAVKEIFDETSTFFARPAQDCCHIANRDSIVKLKAFWEEKFRERPELLKHMANHFNFFNPKNPDYSYLQD
jgi:hypothetical protein